MGMEEEARFERHREEVAVYPKAGDVVMFHCSLLHSGAPNVSNDKRYIFIITYNHAWLKYRADYTGPACQKLIKEAQKRGDRRLPRLLGIDDLMFRRANYGYYRTDEEMWKQWAEEDRAEVVE